MIYVRVCMYVCMYVCQLTLGVSCSWFSFFLTKSFERFLNQWLWLAIAVYWVRAVDVHFNPLAREEVSE